MVRQFSWEGYQLPWSGFLSRFAEYKFVDPIPWQAPSDTHLGRCSSILSYSDFSLLSDWIDEDPSSWDSLVIDVEDSDFDD